MHRNAPRLGFRIEKKFPKGSLKNPERPQETQKWIKLCMLLGAAWVLETPFIFIYPHPTILAILVTAGLFLLVAALIIHQAKTAKIRSLPEFGGVAAEFIALGALFGLLALVVAFLEAQSQ